MPILLGVLAPISWSFIPLIVGGLNNMGPLLILFCALSFFVFSGLFLICFKQNFKHCYKQDKLFYLNAVIGILGFHFFYFEALKIAPIVPVFLIVNITGILNILYSHLFNGVEIKLKHLIAMIINFSAIIIVTSMQNGDTQIQENFNPILGYIYAFIAANCWAIYSAFAARYKDIPQLSIIFPCLVVMVIVFVIFLIRGEIYSFSDISTQELLTLMILGLGPMGYAFIAWNYGMSFGDVRIIAAISYINPILASLWLVLSGKISFEIELIYAFILIILGSLLSLSKLFQQRLF